jgi:hypothetical protein
MRKTAAASFSIASLLIGIAAGIFIGSWPRGASREEPRAPADDRGAEIARLRSRIGELERDAAARKAEAPLPAEEKRAAPPEKPAAERVAAGLPPVSLSSAADADAIYADALARADVDGLIALGAALLAMGDEGYEKALALLEKLGKEAGLDPRLELLGRNDLYAPRLLRSVEENHENLLRFGLWLMQKDPEKMRLPEKEIQLLLGFWQGRDPEIEEGYLSLFREKAEKEKAGGGMDSDIVRALAQIRSDASTDYLVEMMADAPPDRLGEIVAALWYQKSPRALPALRALRASTPDANLMGLLDGAIAAIEAAKR